MKKIELKLVLLVGLGCLAFIPVNGVNGTLDAPLEDIEGDSDASTDIMANFERR